MPPLRLLRVLCASAVSRWSARSDADGDELPPAALGAALLGGELVDRVRARPGHLVLRVVERVLDLRVLLAEPARLGEREARVLERLVELGASPLVRLEEHHLHAALDVHLAVT